MLCAAFAAVTYHQAKKLLGEVNYSPLQENEYIDSSKLAHSDSVRNILLIGVDAREGESSDSTRSDTMMILSIDENNKQLKLTSILRDTYVEIPGWKWNKINAAQSHGGRQLLVDTIEYNFKVDIDNYMLVNFDMFTTIIDELGGVDVEVTEKEANYINARYNMTQAEKDAFPGTTNAGVNHFSGMQALWYSRMRYLDSDFYRTQRQRKVISAIIDKAKSNPTALYSIAEKVMPMIETDLTTDELVNLAKGSVKYMKYDLAQMQVPIDGSWKSVKKSAGNVLSIDMDKNVSAMRTFIYEKADTSNNETTTENSKKK